MSKTRPPSVVAEILRTESLTRAEKIAALRELAYEAREQSVAAEEGMTAGPVLRLGEIQRALDAIGATDDTSSDAKH